MIKKKYIEPTAYLVGIDNDDCLIVISPSGVGGAELTNGGASDTYKGNIDEQPSGGGSSSGDGSEPDVDAKRGTIWFNDANSDW